jgi:hypothetical protein
MALEDGIEPYSEAGEIGHRKVSGENSALQRTPCSRRGGPLGDAAQSSPRFAEFGGGKEREQGMENSIIVVPYSQFFHSTTPIIGCL